MNVGHWLAHWAGADNPNSPEYLLWSGFIPSLGLFSAMGGWWHRHNCQEHRCWRLGRLTTLEDNGHQALRCGHHHHHRHNQGAS
jgi:hypothetical protein